MSSLPFVSFSVQRKLRCMKCAKFGIIFSEHLQTSSTWIEGMP